MCSCWQKAWGQSVKILVAWVFWAQPVQRKAIPPAKPLDNCLNSDNSVTVEACKSYCYSLCVGICSTFQTIHAITVWRLNRYFCMLLLDSASSCSVNMCSCTQKVKKPCSVKEQLFWLVYNHHCCTPKCVILLTEWPKMLYKYTAVIVKTGLDHDQFLLPSVTTCPWHHSMIHADNSFCLDKWTDGLSQKSKWRAKIPLNPIFWRKGFIFGALKQMLWRDLQLAKSKPTDTFGEKKKLTYRKCNIKDIHSKEVSTSVCVEELHSSSITILHVASSSLFIIIRDSRSWLFFYRCSIVDDLSMTHRKWIHRSM